MFICVCACEFGDDSSAGVVFAVRVGWCGVMMCVCLCVYACALVSICQVVCRCRECVVLCVVTS